jgi:hypothetical protein
MKLTYYRTAFLFAVVLITQFTSAAEITYENLVGKWKAERPHPSGATVVVQLEITADHNFSGVAFANSNPIWTYDGTCELKGNELTWTYLHSSSPMPPNMQDTDEILSVDEQHWTYKSTLSGETGSYDRVQ